MQMRKRPVRRSQLITQYGVGALMIDPNGISLIVCGLDHWYKREPGTRSRKAGGFSGDYRDGMKSDIDIAEYRIEEPRLSSLLRVDYFMAPPDYREWNRFDWNRSDANVPNMKLTVPFLRFPTWHFCPSCRRMCKQPLTVQGHIDCQECLDKDRSRRRMVQVPFVGICRAGHIQDVLWNEWIHDSLQPDCTGQLRMIATGIPSLAGQKVQCGLCGRERNLHELLNTPVDSDKTPSYMRCLGQRAWLGEDRAGVPPYNFMCGEVLYVVPRNANNIYYPVVENALYIPRQLLRSDGHDHRELMRRLSTRPVYALVERLLAPGVNLSIEQLAQLIITQHPDRFKDFTQTQIELALQEMRSNPEEAASNASDESGDHAKRSSRTSEFRRVEYNILRQEHMDPDLIVRESPLDRYRADVAQYFSRIMLVLRLRETRVLAGFSRLWPGIFYPKDMLWLNPPPPGRRWLPAHVVYGEGIFFEFNEHKLREWESKHAVQDRLKPLYAGLERKRHYWYAQNVTPRLVLLHTFAHVLMNRLAFECGYSVASLRERLFVADDPSKEMAGVLIYTSSGDAQGTMGGLVRMGRPGYLEPTIKRAISAAIWCSADPICMESVKSVQSDPTLLNLAACHNCALVPEVSCEQFNCLLDRGLLIGSHNNSEIGYFRELVTHSHSG